jgi:nucleotide-binding universal stress UspA family protein
MRAWPPKQILVAVDFGDTSGRACAVAAAVARTTGAEVTVFHAERLEVPPYFTHEQLDLMEGELRLARRHAEAHVRAFAQAHGLAASAVVVVAQTPVEEGILHAAERTDLVVLGSHGRRGPSRWWIGSVSERVVRAAPVPVLVVHPTDRAESADALLDRVLVVGHGHDAERAAQAARELAGAAGGQVEIEASDRAGCGPAVFERATLVVVPLAASGRARGVHDAADALSSRCTVPVLFVPEPTGAHAPRHERTDPASPGVEP